MKIYIAGKITGLKPELAGMRFIHAAFSINKKYPAADILNPVRLPPPENPTWHNWMRVCIQNLADCTHIYMIPGWQFSKGARIEYLISKILKIQRIKL